MNKIPKNILRMISPLLIIYPELVIAIYLIVSILFCLYIFCTDKKLSYYISEKIQVQAR